MTGFHLGGVPLPDDAARTADDGTTVLETDTDAPVTRLRPPPITATPARCRCSHAASMHYRDRKGRPTCASAACGCASYRPKGNQA